ncbi:unnamed protein product [Lactuca virosa]|uniref:Transposase MuDR plant domain-containing protein n=1 Tax=Lactuca virosa TaxID=75947 RepID=A0AAU9MRS2_9ASTR|nr:unnamed protein product [Lactuca virosa]
MEDIHDFDTIDLDLDAYFKRKQVSQCKDEFLHILYEEDDDDANDDAQTEINIEQSNKDYMEGSHEEDTDEDFEYSTRNPKVKWNIIKPTLGERYESPHELNLCLTNYIVSKGFQIRLKKCDNVRIVEICGGDPEK